ncbi:MAG: right-handed parallel beta-helix repeat-containing protein [Spirochaetes bacterium]|nr:right-handed parallel beta-helix repeat-containing protein [Spirochaetota bacterium]
MKKGKMIILSVLAIITLIVWFSCNPFNQQESKSGSIDVLDSADLVKATCDIIGFAQNVTGGEGGIVVQVTTSDEFSAALRLSGPTIIEISGVLDSGYPRCFADKTIIGIGSGAVLDGGVYLDDRANNVIIQNLTITNNQDGVTIRGGTNVWVDHCTFYDCGDGSLDITEDADNVTVSWCKFYYTYDSGHNFVNLIGSSDSDNYPFHVTFHHNWWSTGCVERMPSVRFGRVHVFNNYFNSPGNNYCIRTRINAEVLAENNYFENVQNPWEQYITSGTPGKIRATGNVLINTTNITTSDRLIPDGTDTVFTPPYAYSLDSGSSVKSIVMAGAGAQ